MSCEFNSICPQTNGAPAGSGPVIEEQWRVKPDQQIGPPDLRGVDTSALDAVMKQGSDRIELNLSQRTWDDMRIEANAAPTLPGPLDQVVAGNGLLNLHQTSDGMQAFGLKFGKLNGSDIPSGFRGGFTPQRERGVFLQYNLKF